jgi:hypothetical protein
MARIPWDCGQGKVVGVEYGGNLALAKVPGGRNPRIQAPTNLARRRFRTARRLVRPLVAPTGSAMTSRRNAPPPVTAGSRKSGLSDAPAGRHAGTDPSGALVRRLLREARKAVLASRLEPVAGGAHADWPYASLVLVAADIDGAPILFLSDLSQHARNIAADGRVSLLLDGTTGRKDPLAGPRATLIGVAAPSDEPRLKRRFLALQPWAALYAGFKDFRIYRVEPERAHLVAGFGRIEWVERDALLLPGLLCRGLVHEEENLLASLNAKRRRTQWRVAAIDPEGADLVRAGGLRRVAFAEPAAQTQKARAFVARALRQGGRKA